MNGDTINLQVFTDLQDSTGADFVVELVSSFLEDAPKLLAELERSASSGDASAFRRAAHSLKSNSSTFGAMGLSALARELELAELGALGDRVAPMLARLGTSYQGAADALRRLAHA